ncbi:hypothetical protein IL972_00465 [Acinetobacter sp. FL51]|uniref:hypothetical protein n=1 Tax=Acinetobacter sp. FL51 TaxID=2777978 RepID=UPI0018E0F7DC|nr:hypothetical protein [Acinetobacter sp. FL51]MBI1450411.1 hypothetical protein [Acinetobacter sp. FL51]
MNAQNQSVARIENPLSNGQNQIVHHNQSSSALISTESQRAIAEVQAALAIAKSFPRDRVAAVDRILNDCQRSGLAQVAVYQYARGGTSISGPTIRLAESLAQNWGNIQYGVRELSQANGESTVEAFAWDVETNTRQTKIFQVPHVRYTKSGGAVKLIDPRDIYEAVANNGARRLRACILGVIPGDVVEAALQQCDLTLNTYADTSPEGIQNIIKAFDKYGVSKEALEKRIQCRMEAIKPAQIVSLIKIGTSLKDGMSNPADWFDMSSPSGADAQSNKDEQEDFAALKRRILTIKSSDELDACEEQVMDHTNKDERKQLLQLIKAQAKKFKPTSDVISDQISTSNDVEEKNVSAKKPEVVQEEIPPVTEAKAKKQTSTEIKKEMLAHIETIKNVKDLETIIPLIQGNEILSDAHKTYLINTIEHEISELTKPAVETQAPAVNEIKSNSIANGLKVSIQSAPTVEELTQIAQTIRDSKPSMTMDHFNSVLDTYQLRKKFLEEQQDMFAGVPDVTWTDKAIADIAKAKNQDEINFVYSDPQFEEQSDKDKQRLNLAAQKRETELFGN